MYRLNQLVLTDRGIDCPSMETSRLFPAMGIAFHNEVGSRLKGRELFGVWRIRPIAAVSGGKLFVPPILRIHSLSTRCWENEGSNFQRTRAYIEKPNGCDTVPYNTKNTRI